MPNPLEIYRQWEREAPATTCHVIIIERGNGTAGLRITLTDKPYRDKGVGSAKYHHTYPAPVQCIIGDITSQEGVSGTSFGSIDIAINGPLGAEFEGGYWSFGYALKGKRFRILRGDTRWSLLSTTMPEKFIEIMAGEVGGFTADGVKLQKLTLSLDPVKLNLDKYVGSPAMPVALGMALNIPAVLVDEGTHRYRFAGAIPLDPEMPVRDNGVDLTLGIDYEEVLEGGEFLGLFEFDTAPAGQLTANAAMVESAQLYTVLAKTIHLLYDPDYSQYVQSAAHPAGRETDGPIYFNAVVNKVYTLDRDDPTLYQYSITGGSVATMSYDSVTVTLPHDAPIAITGVSNLVQVRCADSQIYIARYFINTETGALTAMGSEQVIDISAYDDITDITRFDEIFIDPDLSSLALWCKERERLYHVKVVTPGALSTCKFSGRSYHVPFADASFDFGSSGRMMYMYSGGSVTEFELGAPVDLTDIYGTERGYLFDVRFGSNLSLRVEINYSRFYLCSDDSIYEFQFVATGQPFKRELIRTQGLARFVESINKLVGFYYGQQTQLGTILTDIASCIGGAYSVTRLGTINLGRFIGKIAPESGVVNDIPSLQDVSDNAPFVPLSQTLNAPAPSFEVTDRPIGKVILRYAPRFTTQSAATLGGSVTETMRDFYSKSNDVTEFEGESDTGYTLAQKQTIEVDTFLIQGTSAEDLAEQIYAGGTYTGLSYTVTVPLWLIGATVSLNPFDPVWVETPDEVRALQLVERSVNWTKNYQTLTFRWA